MRREYTSYDELREVFSFQGFYEKVYEDLLFDKINKEEMRVEMPAGSTTDHIIKTELLPPLREVEVELSSFYDTKYTRFEVA